MIAVSIGIMAYNESENIGRLLTKLSNQKLKNVQIREILVVSSGSTDGTDKIVSDYSKKNKLIKLLIQKQREGKAKAINLFIKEAKSPVLLMISADTLPESNVVEKLIVPFTDKKVGMTSARIIPTNKQNSFMGFYISVFWKIHHEIAKRTFKAGEAVAWRNVIPGINPFTSTDETNICALILKKELKTVYVPDARVYNKGPENFSDFLKVRRRHIAAYYHLREKVGIEYIPDTMDNLLVFKMFLKIARPKNIKEVLWLLGVAGTEVLGKLTAWYDWRIRKNHHPIWQIAKSTKTLPEVV